MKIKFLLFVVVLFGVMGCSGEPAPVTDETVSQPEVTVKPEAPQEPAEPAPLPETAESSEPMVQSPKLPSPLDLDPEDIPDGSSPEKAIPVNDTSTEYVFVRWQTCGDGSVPRVTRQVLLESDSGPQDVLTVACEGEENRDYHFDIGSFYGNFELYGSYKKIVEPLLEEMDAALAQKEWDKAKALALLIIEQEPYQPEAYLALTAVSVQQENWPDTLRYASVALRLMPTWTEGQEILRFARQQKAGTPA